LSHSVIGESDVGSSFLFAAALAGVCGYVEISDLADMSYEKICCTGVPAVFCP
jgi:hypothetical protein